MAEPWNEYATQRSPIDIDRAEARGPWEEFARENALGQVQETEIPASPFADEDFVAQYMGYEDPRDPSFRQGFTKGLAKPVLNMGRLGEEVIDTIGLEDLVRSIEDYLDPNGPRTIEETQQQLDRQLAEDPYRPSGAGEFIGEAVGTAPVAALTRSPFLQGAISSAMSTDKRDAIGIGVDAALGGLIGKGAELGLRGASSVIAPKVTPAVRKLTDEGVPLTAGQIVGQNGVVGGSIKRIEDSLAQFPIIGDTIRNARARGDEALNRAVTNRALRPIGEVLPNDVQVGQDAVAYAGDRLRDAYREVLPRLNGQLDRTFETRIDAVRQRANLPPEYDAMLDQAQQELGNAFTGNGPEGIFSGRTLRDASERLEDLASAWRRNDDPYIRRVGDAAEEYRQQLHALARRQNPEQAQRLRDIDRGYASLVRLETASAKADDGIFSAGQYRTATRQADRSTRKRATARGEALDQDLSSAASQVMPSQVGQGGSMAVNSLAALTGLGTSALYGVPGALGVIGATGAGSLLYTSTGQKLAQRLLARQAGPQASALADFLGNGVAPNIGIVGGAAPALLSGSE